jgi:hypothetical protein
MASDAADSHRPIGSIRRKPKSVEGHVVAYSPVWGPVAVALGVFLTVAGIMHFVNPSFAHNYAKQRCDNSVKFCKGVSLHAKVGKRVRGA